MPLDRPYTTVKDIVSYTNDCGITTEHGELAIDLASRFIDQYCNRDFWRHDHSLEALHVDDRDIFPTEIILPFPIESLSEIESKGVAVLDSKYRWFKSGRIILLDENESWDTHTIKIKGVFGYEIDNPEEPPINLPSAIRRAATVLAATLTNHNTTIPPFSSGESIPVKDIPEEVYTLLKQHRRSPV